MRYRAWDRERGLMLPVIGLMFAPEEASAEQAPVQVLVPAPDNPQVRQRRLLAGVDCVLLRGTGLRDATAWDELLPIERERWLVGGGTPHSWRGREIYEGDIVRFRPLAQIARPWTQGVVIWLDGCPCIRVPEEQTRGGQMYHYASAWFRYELKVIGNRFEFEPLEHEQAAGGS